MVACAIVLVGTCFVLWRQRFALAASVPLPLKTPWTVVIERTNAWRSAGPPSPIDGVVFGDSVLINDFVPAMAASLTQRGFSAEVLDLTYQGFSAFQFYYALQDVLAAHPRFAVIEVNLRTFAPDWYGNAGLRTPQLTARLSFAQSLRLHQALATQNLGLFAPATYRLQHDTGTLFLMDGVRGKIAAGFDRVGHWINRKVGLSTRSPTEALLHEFPLELDATTARLWFERDFTASPTSEMLRALVHDLHRAGIVAFVFVAPLRLVRLGELNIDLIQLDRRIEHLRQFVGVPEDDWTQTNDLMEPDDFQDAIHVLVPARKRLAQFIADALWRRLNQGSASAPVLQPERGSGT